MTRTWVDSDLAQMYTGGPYAWYGGRDQTRLIVTIEGREDQLAAGLTRSAGPCDAGSRVLSTAFFAELEHRFLETRPRRAYRGVMPADTPDRPEGAPVGRRIVLGLLGLGALGIVTGTALQDGLGTVLGPVELRDPTGLAGLIPSGDTFRYYSVTGGVDEPGPRDYQLAVSGLVERPGQHTLADLQAMPQTSLVRDFQCVTGWRVPEVPWVGVQLAHLLDLAGPTRDADAVRLTSFDGAYTESLTLEQARRPDVLVALQMLGAPVTHDHGGPVRLYVAPMYGYKSLKWLSGIELTQQVVPGYWEEQGYEVDGWVGASNGRSDDPTS